MRFAFPRDPSSLADNEQRHSRGYAQFISPASIGRVRFAAMKAEVRAHLQAHAETGGSAGAAVTDAHGVLCVRRSDEVVYLVVQDMVSALQAIEGSVDLLLHSCEDVREREPTLRLTLMVVGVGTAGADCKKFLGELTKRYQVTFRYVPYHLGATSFPV